MVDIIHTRLINACTKRIPAVFLIIVIVVCIIPTYIANLGLLRINIPFPPLAAISLRTAEALKGSASNQSFLKKLTRDA